MPARATIQDVANRAGVSKTTVSFVLTNRPGHTISEPVKRRIFAAVRELDYHPRATAIGLSRGRTRNILVLFSHDTATLSNPFYSFVMEGVVQETLARDHNLLFSTIDGAYRTKDQLPKVILEQNADGVLLVSRINLKVVRDLRALGLPLLAIDPFPAVRGLCTVGLDSEMGGALAARHLLELGHERLAILAGDVDRPSIAARIRGFRAALSAGRRGRRPAPVYEAKAMAIDEARDRARQLLGADRAFTGLFCVNDDVAAGVLQAAHELGVEVPAQLSIVGFDNVALCTTVYPQLTSIDVDKRQLGHRAVAGLISLIEGSQAAMHDSLPMRLVVRSSTAAPG